MTLTAEPRADCQIHSLAVALACSLASPDPQNYVLCWVCLHSGLCRREGESGTAVVEVGLDRRGHLCASRGHLGDRGVSNQESGQGTLMADHTSDVRICSYFSI